MAVVGKNPIAEGNFHGFLPVTVKALNSYSKSFTSVDRTKKKTVTGDRTKTETPSATEVSHMAELLQTEKKIYSQPLILQYNRTIIVTDHNTVNVQNGGELWKRKILTGAISDSTRDRRMRAMWQITGMESGTRALLSPIPMW